MCWEPHHNVKRCRRTVAALAWSNKLYCSIMASLTQIPYVIKYKKSIKALEVTTSAKLTCLLFNLMLGIFLILYSNMLLLLDKDIGLLLMI